MHNCTKDMSHLVWIVDSFESFSPEQHAEFKRLLNENVSRIVPVQDENNPGPAAPAVNRVIGEPSPSTIFQDDSKDLLKEIISQSQ